MTSMKKLLLTSFIAITLFTNSLNVVAQKVAQYQCKWHQEIEQGSVESLIDQMQLHEKSQFMYMISNDEENLFIELVTTDKAAIQKVMKYGLTTWINKEARQKKGMGIEFPVAPEGQRDPGFRRDKGGDRKEMMFALMARKNQEMALIGFVTKGERILIDPRIDSSFHGNVVMLESEQLSVSLVLPLEKIDRSADDLKAHPFSLGFETGYMDVTGQGMSSGGSKSDGGRSMHGGGGPPHGASPDGQTGSVNQQQQLNINQLASPSRMWIKHVILAK